MNILICDDHGLFAEALATILEGRGYRVVGIAPVPEDAIDVVRDHDVDVCLMDIHFQAADGIEGTARLRAASPTTRVIVLSGYASDDLVGAATTAGASAYVLKGERTQALLSTIEAVANGDGPARVPVPLRKLRPAPPAGGRLLTPREHEVLERMVSGQPMTRIAREMGIAYSTARTHAQNILTKLGVHSRLAAVAFAIDHGLVRLGPERRSAASAPSHAT